MNSTNAVFVWLCGQSSRNTKSSINDKNENIATLTHPLYSPSWLQQWVQAFFIASVLFRSSRRIKRKKLLWCAVPSLAQLKVALSLQLTYLTNIFCNKTCRIINTSGFPQTWQKFAQNCKIPIAVIVFLGLNFSRLQKVEHLLKETGYFWNF